MTHIQEIFIKNLRFLRSKAGFSQLEFSEKIGLSPNYLNAVENVSEEMVSLMVKSYIDFHESIRNTKYNEVCDFLDALAYDAIFMNALDEGNIQNLTNHDLNISSFNYLIATSPDFFKNEEVMARAQQVLEQEKRTTKVFSKKKKNINNIKKSLKYIGEKEE